MEYSIDFLGNHIKIPVGYRTSIQKGDFIKDPNGNFVQFDRQDESTGEYITLRHNNNNERLRYSNIDLITRSGTINKYTKEEKDSLLLEEIDTLLRAFHIGHSRNNTTKLTQNKITPIAEAAKQEAAKQAEKQEAEEEAAKQEESKKTDELTTTVDEVTKA